MDAARPKGQQFSRRLCAAQQGVLDIKRYTCIMTCSVLSPRLTSWAGHKAHF